LGSGKRGAAEIKEHPFLANLSWDDAAKRKLPVPKPYLKNVAKQDIDLERIYGKGAFDTTLKNKNKVREWTFLEPAP